MGRKSRAELPAKEAVTKEETGADVPLKGTRIVDRQGSWMQAGVKTGDRRSVKPADCGGQEAVCPFLQVPRRGTRGAPEPAVKNPLH
ncbi:hypothetical protein SKAU_G00368080 [Synaphobranchus kaupii]|uniref:Uncharacterized protein n=1 Tax=Synaphobranchus kaupii TaxID=118154 RepID=A0A9Q1EFI5_SYNKA|nr:hypothetical protein SKAU_G00368080 [Synaphobranchus kaupii]